MVRDLRDAYLMYISYTVRVDLRVMKLDDEPFDGPLDELSD